MWIRFTRSFWGATLYIRAGMSFFDKRSQEHEIRAEKWPGIVLWNHLEPSVLIHKPLHACFKPYIFSFCSWLLLSNSDDIRSKARLWNWAVCSSSGPGIKKVFKKHSVAFHDYSSCPPTSPCVFAYIWVNAPKCKMYTHIFMARWEFIDYASNKCVLWVGDWRVLNIWLQNCSRSLIKALLETLDLFVLLWFATCNYINHQLIVKFSLLSLSPLSSLSRLSLSSLSLSPLSLSSLSLSWVGMSLYGLI